MSAGGYGTASRFVVPALILTTLLTAPLPNDSTLPSPNARLPFCEWISFVQAMLAALVTQTRRLPGDGLLERFLSPDSTLEASPLIASTLIK
jgi:hypothetical protein